jgi:hypothetical protein
LASRATADRYSGVISGFPIMCILMLERDQRESTPSSLPQPSSQPIVPSPLPIDASARLL